jgi:arylsulfatase A-like enzyme
MNPSRLGRPLYGHKKGHQTSCSSSSTTLDRDSSHPLEGWWKPPNIDRVAAMGLRYANMHTTALCSMAQK